MLTALGLDPSLASKGYLATIRFGHCVIGLLRAGHAELLPLQSLAWPRQWVQMWPVIGASQWPPATHLATARLTPIAVGIRQSQFGRCPGARRGDPRIAPRGLRRCRARRVPRQARRSDPDDPPLHPCRITGQQDCLAVCGERADCQWLQCLPRAWSPPAPRGSRSHDQLGLRRDRYPIHHADQPVLDDRALFPGGQPERKSGPVPCRSFTAGRQACPWQEPRDRSPAGRAIPARADTT